MKVLFAIGDDKTSKIIADKYYEKYGEVLEYKNVFYFKALLEEVKRDKTYQRIVISEELEQFSTTNYDAVDQFLFTKIDNITDEIQDADIIIICSERRTKSDRLLSRLFAIGIYNMLIGEDRDFDPLCRIIKKPKTKREAKLYLNLDPTLDMGSFSSRNDEVEEAQLINIINYYEKLGNDEEKYVEAFDNIAEQYSREQLKVIISSLKPKIRNVISNVEKYKYLFEDVKQINDNTTVNKDTKAAPKKLNFFSDFKILKKNKDEKQSRERDNKEKEEKERKEKEEQDRLEKERAEQERIALEKEQQERVNREQAEQERIEREKEENDRLVREKEEQDRLARERAEQEKIEREEQDRQVRERVEKERLEKLEQEKERLARVKEEQERLTRIKSEQEKFQNEELINEIELLPELVIDGLDIGNEKIDQEKVGAEQERLAREKAEQDRLAREKAEQDRLAREKAEQDRLAREKAEQERLAREKAQQERIAREKAEKERIAREKAEQEKLAKEKAEQERLAREKAQQERLAREKAEQERLAVNKPTVVDSKEEIRPVFELPRDYRKLVVFVGPNKSGTTFMANAVSYATSSRGIPTALVDMTRDRGIYYIHTQDNEKLRKIASTCMQNLSSGVDIPIQSSKNKNLNVYTAVPGAPGDDRRLYKHTELLNTLKQRNSLVILDCDFTTPYDYFELASEIYVVQDMDVLKMQDTTMFLRELKNRKTDMQKIRVIINKYVKATLTPKTIIEVGLSYYNDPSMSFVDTLLPGRVLYSVVPYDLDNYRKYIEILFAANGLDFSNFSQEFLNAVDDISQQVYPTGNKQTSKKRRGLFG